MNEDTGESITVQNVSAGTWLIVNISNHGQRKSNSKKSGGTNLIGVVQEVSSDGKGFTAKFVRPKPSRDFSGFVYGFPNVKDEASFSFDQIRQVLVEPERYGRGYFKFEVHVNELNC